MRPVSGPRQREPETSTTVSPTRRPCRPASLPSSTRIDERPIADVRHDQPYSTSWTRCRRVGTMVWESREIEADAGHQAEDLAERLRGVDALARAFDQGVQVDPAEARIPVVLDQVLADLVEHLQAALAVDGNRLRRGGRGQAQSQARIRPQETNARAIHGERTGRHLIQARRSVEPSTPSAGSGGDLLPERRMSPLARRRIQWRMETHRDRP